MLVGITITKAAHEYSDSEADPSSYIEPALAACTLWLFHFAPG